LVNIEAISHLPTKSHDITRIASHRSQSPALPASSQDLTHTGVTRLHILDAFRHVSLLRTLEEVSAGAQILLVFCPGHELVRAENIYSFLEREGVKGGVRPKVTTKGYQELLDGGRQNAQGEGLVFGGEKRRSWRGIIAVVRDGVG
jgi:hypothetical protein